MIKWHEYNQYFAGIAASILVLGGGTIISWTAPVLPLLMSKDSPLDHQIDLTEASAITSILLLGNVFGNFFVGLSLNHLGRRLSLLICALPVSALWIGIYFTKSVYVIYVIRFLIGFLGAFPVAAATVYMSEIVETHIRGAMTMFLILMLEAGQLLVIVAGSYVSYQNLSILCGIMPAIFFVVFIWFPESPYFYLRKGDVKKAENCLKRLRSSSISKELEIMRECVEEEMKTRSTIRDIIFSKEYRRELLIVLGLKSLHQLSGNSAIQNYIGLIFSLASTGLDANTSSIICSSVSIPAMLVAMYIIDKHGRKPLYYVSTIGCAIALFLEFIYFLLQDNLKMNVESITWLPITGIFLFYIFRPIGITTLAHLYMGELFPSNIKGSAVALSLTYGSTISFLVVFGFGKLSVLWGISFTFLLFSIFCLSGFFFVMFFVPETKGKSLEELHILLKTQITKF